MDTTKLIEEAEREIAHMKAEALSAENPYNENTIRLTLIMDLVSALKASEDSLQDARAELAPRIACIGRMEEERRALQSANLSANKRIVELEHELGEWMRRAQGWESEAAIATERFNQLSAAQPGEPLDMDCGDSACAFAKTRGGMRTNGGCRCLENLGFCRGQTDSLRRMAAEIVSLRKRLSDLTTPRPIAEAPRDGTRILAYMPSTETWMVLVWLVRKECWACPDFPHVGYYDPAEYLPLPEVKP